MQRTIATLSMFSLILVAAGSALADAADEAEQNRPACSQKVREVGASCAAPAGQPDGVETAKVNERDFEIPVYIPPTRGSTLVRAGSTRGPQGVRRPGLRL